MLILCLAEHLAEDVVKHIDHDAVTRQLVLLTIAYPCRLDGVYVGIIHSH